MGSDGANPPARKGVRDQPLSGFRGMAAILVSGGNAVGNFHHLVRAGRAGKAAQADDGIVCDMDDREAVFPRISSGRSIQSLEKIRGYLRSREKVSCALSESDAEAALVSINSLKKCA